LVGEFRSAWRESCTNATLSTTNPTWAVPRSIASLRSQKPATNRLSYGTTLNVGRLWLK